MSPRVSGGIVYRPSGGKRRRKTLRAGSVVVNMVRWNAAVSTSNELGGGLMHCVWFWANRIAATSGEGTD